MTAVAGRCGNCRHRRTCSRVAWIAVVLQYAGHLRRLEDREQNVVFAGVGLVGRVRLGDCREQVLREAISSAHAFWDGRFPYLCLDRAVCLVVSPSVCAHFSSG